MIPTGKWSAESQVQQSRHSPWRSGTGSPGNLYHCHQRAGESAARGGRLGSVFGLGGRKTISDNGWHSRCLNTGPESTSPVPLGNRLPKHVKTVEKANASLLRYKQTNQRSHTHSDSDSGTARDVLFQKQNTENNANWNY